MCDSLKGYPCQSLDIACLRSDLYLSEVIGHELDVTRDNGSIARQEPVYGYAYDAPLYDDWTEDAADKAGIVAPGLSSSDVFPVATDMEKKRKPASMKPLGSHSSITS